MRKLPALCALAMVVLSGSATHSLRARLPHQGNNSASVKSQQIVFHGGPVMTQGAHLYVIYYGNFTPNAGATDIIDTFLENLGGSGAYGVNDTYHDASGNSIINTKAALAYARLADSYYDAYSLGASMKNNNIAQEIQNVLRAGKLPADNNGIYILITSPDVAVAKSYCGYHTASTSLVQGYNIKYAFSPDPAPPTYNGCSGNISTYGDTTSPNGDVGADSVTDTLIHEISETVTDPNLNAWYTANGYENGDLCNFVYGSATFVAPNGSHANHTFGSRNYLVQTIWQNTGAGFCSLNNP